jgi:hypothetical protein
MHTEEQSVEERIRALAARAFAAEDVAELEIMMRQLRDAVREYADLLRETASKSRGPTFPQTIGTA